MEEYLINNFKHYLTKSNERNYVNIIFNSYLIYYGVKKAYFDVLVINENIQQFLNFLETINLKYEIKYCGLFIVKKHVVIPENVLNNIGKFLGYQESYHNHELINVVNFMSICVSKSNEPPDINIINNNLENGFIRLRGIYDYNEIWIELFNSQPFDFFTRLVLLLNLHLNKIGYNGYIMLGSKLYKKVIVFTKDNVDNFDLLNNFTELMFNLE